MLGDVVNIEREALFSRYLPRRTEGVRLLIHRIYHQLIILKIWIQRQRWIVLFSTSTCHEHVDIPNALMLQKFISCSYLELLSFNRKRILLEFTGRPSCWNCSFVTCNFNSMYVKFLFSGNCAFGLVQLLWDHFVFIIDGVNLSPSIGYVQRNRSNTSSMLTNRSLLIVEYW